MLKKNKILQKSNTFKKIEDNKSSLKYYQKKIK